MIYGGVSLLTLLTGDADSASNPLRQDLWRAGHAHAAVLLMLPLLALLLAEHAQLSTFWERLAATLIPASAILLPAAFFLSVASPTATRPNGLISLAYVGAAALVAGVLILGIGLMRRPVANL